MKQKIIMFTLVTIILFCAVLIGYQIPKQQVKMKQNQIEDLQEEQRILRDKNGELNKLVKRQSKTVISDEEKQIREVSSNFVKQMFEMKKDVNSGLKMLFYGGLKMSFFSGLRLSYI
ncbi:transposon-related protein [Staphylococcus aureus]|nr:transposon-related protein [Staphylococcus aureus]